MHATTTPSIPDPGAGGADRRGADRAVDHRARRRRVSSQLAMAVVLLVAAAALVAALVLSSATTPTPTNTNNGGTGSNYPGNHRASNYQRPIGGKGSQSS